TMRLGRDHYVRVGADDGAGDGPRRSALLMAVVRQLEVQRSTTPLDLFAVLMANRLAPARACTRCGTQRRPRKPTTKTDGRHTRVLGCRSSPAPALHRVVPETAARGDDARTGRDVRLLGSCPCRWGISR